MLLLEFSVYLEFEGKKCHEVVQVELLEAKVELEQGYFN